MKSANYINNPNDARRQQGCGSLAGWGHLLWLGLAIVLLGASCASNLYLEKGQYLVKGEPTFSKSKQVKADTTVKMRIESLKELGLSTVDPDLLYSSVRTKPNRKMLWPKTYLHLYNLGRSLQRYEYPFERFMRIFKPHNHVVDSVASFLVRTAGEPPAIIDSLVLEKDIENLKNVYFSQGFFHTKVFYRVDTCRSRLNAHKANVTYLIDEGKAAIIDKIRTPLIADSVMRKVLLRNMADSYLHSGDTYKEDNFSAERGRISTVMRNNGYFAFSPKMISFDIDTLPPDTLGTMPNNEAIKDYQPIWIQIKVPDTQPRYKVGHITMLLEPAEFDPAVDTIMKSVTAAMMTDSLRKEWHLSRTHLSDSSRITFNTYERVLARMNLNFLEKLVTLVQGDDYSLINERKTQQRLQNLGIFKYVLIKPSTGADSASVDFTIQAVLMQRFQVKAGFEGFFENDAILKSNLPGVGAEIGLRDKLVFKGAEKLDLSAKGSTRFYRRSAGDTLFTFLEGTASASLQFPRILVPGLASKNIQGFEPSTSFSTNISRQQSRDYVRNSLSLDWNYRWYHSSTNKKAQSSVSPYVVTLIQSTLKPVFIARIQDIQNDALRALIIQDYRERFSSWGNYKFTYNNATASKLRHSLQFIGNAQMGGNTPFLIDKFNNIDNSVKDFRLGRLYYGQYYKLSVELKNNWPLGRHASFVMRNYTGVADPWNYTLFVPFESRFFVGGANSMRGWRSNSLGPGTYNPDTLSHDPNLTAEQQQAKDDSTNFNFGVSPGGEFVFETNIELRFDVYKWIKMAIFSDVGNVWFLPGSKVDFEGSQLSKKTILQLGWDVGVGVRLDFDFLLFRIDLAKQIYAPDERGFVIKSTGTDLASRRFQLNFGIGYPF